MDRSYFPRRLQGSYSTVYIPPCRELTTQERMSLAAVANGIEWHKESDGHFWCESTQRDASGKVRTDALGYPLRYDQWYQHGAWNCTCPGFRSHGHCKHAQGLADSLQGTPAPVYGDALLPELQ